MEDAVRQAALDTIDALTEHIVRVHTAERRTYDAHRDGPVQWGYPMIGRPFERSRRTCR